MGKFLHLSLNFWKLGITNAVPKDSLAELSEVALKNNIFEFDEKNFQTDTWNRNMKDVRTSLCYSFHGGF